MKIKTFLFGLQFMLLDNQSEFLNTFHRDVIYIHKHSTEDDLILISDKTKPSAKDSIVIAANELTEIDGFPLLKASRSVALVYLHRAMNSTSLNIDRNLDGFKFVNLNQVALSPDLVTPVDENYKPHFFNTNSSAVAWALENHLQDDLVFRITNAGLETMTLNANLPTNNFILKEGSENASLDVLAGETVEVSYNFNRKEYSLISLS